MREEAARISPEKAGGTLGRRKWKWEEMKNEREKSERERGLMGGGVNFLQFSSGGSYFLGMRWSDQCSFTAIY